MKTSRGDPHLLHCLHVLRRESLRQLLQCAAFLALAMPACLASARAVAADADSRAALSRRWSSTPCIQQARRKEPDDGARGDEDQRAETLLQQARAVTLPLVTTTISNSDAGQRSAVSPAASRSRRISSRSRPAPACRCSRRPAGPASSRRAIRSRSPRPAPPKCASRSWCPPRRRIWRSSRRSGRWKSASARSRTRARISTTRRSGSRAAPAAG